MATTINAGSVFLAAASPRLLTAPNADIILKATSTIFHVNAAGISDTSSTIISATLLSLEGTVEWSVVGATLASVSGNTAVLDYTGMTGTKATVTATLTYRGVVFSEDIVISVVSDGASGLSYTWIRYADDINGAGISDSGVGKTHLGIGANKTTATESANPADYSWSLIAGTDGVQGEPGLDGDPLYMWVAYSDNPDGTGLYQLPISSTVYIGIATNKTTAVESSVKEDYVWSRFKGDQGVPGDGADGNRGAGHYYATGSSWTDAVADSVTPAGNVLDDVVTISNGTTFVSEKRWTGSAWVDNGVVIDGSLIVEQSITSAQINVNGLTVNKPDGTPILTIGGLQAGFEAPGTLNSDIVIGGRNLYPDSGFERGTHPCTERSAAVLRLSIDGVLEGNGTPYAGTKALFVFSDGGDAFAYLGGSKATVVAGRQYVLSFYYLSAGAITGSSTFFRCSDGTHVSVPLSGLGNGSTWTRNIQLWTCPVGVTSLEFRLGISCSGSAWIAADSIQVEEGNKATQSAPAPEDTQADIADKLNKNSNDILGGILSIDTVAAPAGFRAGSLTWNAAGDRTGGYGVAMTPKGLVGYKADGTLTFSMSATTGDIAVKGDISGSTGTFGAVTIGSTMSMGQTAYNTGTGAWFQGGATPKMSMKTDNGASFLCDPGNNVMSMTGATLTNPTLVMPTFSVTLGGTIDSTVPNGQQHYGNLTATVVSTDAYEISWMTANVSSDDSLKPVSAKTVGTATATVVGVYGSSDDNSFGFDVVCTITSGVRTAIAKYHISAIHGFIP